ncbi:MAG: hypothetical protein ACETWR_21320 [Anaerolineae bacterium]
MTSESLTAYYKRLEARLARGNFPAHQTGAMTLARALIGQVTLEPACIRCQDALPGYMADQRAGIPLSPQNVAFHAHLSTCPYCSLVFAQLLVGSRLEERGILPRPRADHGPDLTFLDAGESKPPASDGVSECL